MPLWELPEAVFFTSSVEEPLRIVSGVFPGNYFCNSSGFPSEAPKMPSPEISLPIPRILSVHPEIPLGVSLRIFFWSPPWNLLKEFLREFLWEILQTSSVNSFQTSSGMSSRNRGFPSGVFPTLSPEISPAVFHEFFQECIQKYFQIFFEIIWVHPGVFFRSSSWNFIGSFSGNSSRSSLRMPLGVSPEIPWGFSLEFT